MGFYRMSQQDRDLRRASRKYCSFKKKHLQNEALREKGQTPKNLLTSAELFHVRRGYHGDGVVVHDAKVVHPQAITHWELKSQHGMGKND